MRANQQPPPPRKPEERPVNGVQACELLGLSQSYVSALKRAMGLKSRYFFLSDMRKYLRKTPTFRVAQVYSRGSKTRHVETSAAMQTNHAPMTEPASAAANFQNSPAIRQRPQTAVIEERPAGAATSTAGDRQQQPSGKQTANLRKALFAKKFRAVFGKWSTDELVQCSRRSRETVRRLQLGNRTKFSTFKGIISATGIAKQDWAALLPYWIKVELGDDADLLRIELATGADGGDQVKPEGPISELFASLSLEEREIILETMQQREVIAALPALLKLASMRNGNGDVLRKRKSRDQLPAHVTAIMDVPQGEQVDQSCVKPVAIGSKAADSTRRTGKRCRTELMARAALNRPWDQL